MPENNDNSTAALLSGNKDKLSHFERWNQPRDPANRLNSNDSMIIGNNIEAAAFERSLSNSSSCSSFVSAVSSLDESIYSAEEGSSWIYIEGPRPSKTDLQVYEALSDFIIDPSKYPRIHTWKCSVESSTVQERKQWKKNYSKNKKPIIKFSFMDESVTN